MKPLSPRKEQFLESLQTKTREDLLVAKAQVDAQCLELRNQLAEARTRYEVNGSSFTSEWSEWYTRANGALRHIIWEQQQVNRALHDRKAAANEVRKANGRQSKLELYFFHVARETLSEDVFEGLVAKARAAQEQDY